MDNAQTIIESKKIKKDEGDRIASSLGCYGKSSSSPPWCTLDSNHQRASSYKDMSTCAERIAHSHKVKKGEFFSIFRRSQEFCEPKQHSKRTHSLRNIFLKGQENSLFITLLKNSPDSWNFLPGVDHSSGRSRIHSFFQVVIKATYIKTMGKTLPPLTSGSHERWRSRNVYSSLQWSTIVFYLLQQLIKVSASYGMYD